MNRLPGWLRQHIAALRGLLVFTVICGIAYPVVMWGVAQVAFHNTANGSLVSYHGRGWKYCGSGLPLASVNSWHSRLEPTVRP